MAFKGFGFIPTPVISSFRSFDVARIKKAWNGFVFVSIPRCASRSIFKILQEDPTGPLKDADRHFCHFPRCFIPISGFSFAVIRNPIDRFISLVNYWNLVSSTSLSVEECAETFIGNLGSKVSRICYHDAHVASSIFQIDFLRGGVTCLLPFESLNKWVGLLLSFLGYPNDGRVLPHITEGRSNASFRDGREMDRAIKSALEDFLLPDFALWNEVSSKKHTHRLEKLFSGSLKDWKPV